MKTETRVHTTPGGHNIIKVVDETGTWYFIEGQPGRRFDTLQEAIEEAEAQEEEQGEAPAL